MLEDRYHVRSTLVTCQFPFKNWHELIGDPTLADAILVLRQHDIAGFRVTHMRQCKTQSAGNGKPFSRTATPHWRMWVAPFGNIMLAEH